MTKKTAFHRASHAATAAALALLLAPVSGIQSAKADGSLTQTVQFDIPPQLLTEALIKYSQQSGIQVSSPASLLDGKSSSGVMGTLSASDALARVLAGTSLAFDVIDKNTVAIRAVKPKSASGAAQVAGAGGAVLLAQVEQPYSSEVERKGEDKKELSSEEGFSSTKGIPEILVKGSRSLNTDIQRTRDDVQPYVTFDRETIRGSGVNNINELLKSRLTMNYPPGFGNLPQSSAGDLQAGIGNRSEIALRGLSSAQTLILIDGRRVVSGSVGGNSIQPDLNAIPLSAIERIEVLPSTAAGIYGGGAVGGVVNIVMRRDYTGAEVDVNFENSFRNDGGTRRINLNATTHFFEGRTRLSTNASYSDATPIKFSDREFLREYQQRKNAALIELEGPSVILPLSGSATNIRSTTGAPLVLKSQYGGTALNSSFTSAPAGYAGIASDSAAALVANAGKFNLDPANTADNGARRRDIAGAPIVRSIDLTLQHEFNPRTEAFVGLTASRNDSYIERVGVGNITTLPGTAQGNPFQQTIQVRFPIYTDDTANVSKMQNLRGTLGIKRNIASTWQAELDYTFSRYDIRESMTPSLYRAGTTGFVTQVRSGALDIFKDDSVTQDIKTYLVDGYVTAPTHSIQQGVSLRAAGTLFDLPGGDVSLSTLAEYRKETNSESTQLFNEDSGGEVHHSDQSATVRSLYVEANIPVVSEINRVTGVHSLNVQLAARRDAYRQDTGYYFGDALPTALTTRYTNHWNSTDPTIGIRFEPIRDIAVRGSYGTGFLPPSLTDLVPSQTILQDFTANAVVDPRRNGEAVQIVEVAYGGNQNLRPEKSQSYSFGVILKPRWLETLRVSLDWTKISKTNNITSISSIQDAINLEGSVPGLIVRGPVDGFSCNPDCPIVRWNANLINNARAETRSYDISLDYSFPLAQNGTVNVAATGTRMIRNISQVNQLTPFTNSAGLIGAPYWNAVGSVTWSNNSLSIGWATRYLDSYWLFEDHHPDSLFGMTQVSNTAYHDLTARYQFGKEAGVSLLSGLELRAGIKNVFDKAPRFTPVGLYDSWGDPQLRAYYISVRKQIF